MAVSGERPGQRIVAGGPAPAPGRQEHGSAQVAGAIADAPSLRRHDHPVPSGAEMAGIADHRRPDAVCPRQLDRPLHRDLGGDLAQPVVAVERRMARAARDFPHLGPGIHGAARKRPHIEGQHSHPMRMHPAQVGVNQGPRREFGACGVHADGLQQTAGECFELLMRDRGP